jgi:hypothetical protein
LDIYLACDNSSSQVNLSIIIVGLKQDL